MSTNSAAVSLAKTTDHLNADTTRVANFVASIKSVSDWAAGCTACGLYKEIKLLAGFGCLPEVDLDSVQWVRLAKVYNPSARLI